MKRIILFLSILGLTACQTVLQSPTALSIAPSSTESPTHAPVPTYTPTQLPRYSVSGTVFLDLNGDGIQGESEPPLQNAIITIAESMGQSGEDGRYIVNDVAPGEWDLRVLLDGLPFIAASMASYFSADEGLPIEVDSPTNLSIGLMQGVLTIPFSSRDSFYVLSWMDLDPADRKVRRYDGDTTECNWIKFPTEPIVGTGDTHNGIDYVAEEGTQILAVAPGIVFYAPTPEDQARDCLNVFILHRIGDDYFLSQYGHNSQNLVQEGQAVNRGQAIALVGHSCTGVNHLHFAWFSVSKRAVSASDGGEKRGIINDAIAIDTYRDLQNSDSVSFWTKDNDPQFPDQ